MTDDRRLTIGRGAATLAGLALLLAGAGLTFLFLRSADRTAKQGNDLASPAASGPAPASPAPPATAGDAPLPDIEVTLTPDAVARAGIEVASVTSTAATDAVRIPGTIEADAYRRVAVTSVVAGRITRVSAELGQAVKRGSTLAQIYSPGLAEAQTKYLTVRAGLEAATQELTRTERLVEIGAASRQELERIRASHTAHATSVEGARTQLVLLGMTPAAIDRLTSASAITASASVPAPIDGIVTERQANPGLNVEPSTPLFTIVDLSSVWVMGDLYEKDFPRVRVGSRATVTTTAYPGLALEGRVAYIDPQVDGQTRTAQVRVEVRNPRRELRLGMYAEVQILAPGGRHAVTVPREAVQTIGDRHVVYLSRPGRIGQFIEREVRVGEVTGALVEIASGVNAGDAVVTRGSFFVRAERERLGLRRPGGQASPGAMGDMPGMAIVGGAPADTARQRPPSTVVKITVGDAGFLPARVEAAQGGVVRLEFTRSSDKTCATEIVVPSQQIRRALPLNTPVQVQLRVPEAGEIAFSCGMDMLKGTVVVR